MPPAEEEYLGWLYSKVAKTSRSTPSNSHYHLLQVMHTTEFVWQLSGDDNRAEDGRDLRREYELLTGIPSCLDDQEASVLEMFVALCFRIQVQTDVPAKEWFWEFMNNLGLDEYDDAHFDQESVESILDTFIWRQFGQDGSGGAFPIKEPEHDQRKVEIWYQFWQYLKDQDRLL